MKALKIVGNIFGMLFAIIFSIVLVLVLVAIPPVKSLSSIFQADTIQSMLVDVAGPEVIAPGSLMVDGLEEVGLSEEIVQELMDTDAVEDLLDVYLDTVFSAAEGETMASSFTSDMLESIVDENKDELIPLIEEYADVENEEEAEELLDIIVEEHSEDIMEVLSSAADSMPAISDSGDGALLGAWNVIRGLYNGAVAWILVGAAAVLSVLIFLCRKCKLQGVLWLGVSYAIAAVLSVFVRMLAGNMNLLMNMGMSGMERNMINAIVSGMLGAMTIGTLVIAALAVVFIVVYIVLKTRLKKKVQ